MSTQSVYLDNAATTAVDPAVAEAMLACLGPQAEFGNPASHTHRWGLSAFERVEEARTSVADLVGAYPEEVVFTSGATEADNLAILGTAARHPGGHMISVLTEHKAVLDPLAALSRAGWVIELLPVAADGQIDLDRLAAAIRPDTRLISVMHVNNEIGVVQDIAAIGALARAKGVVFHVDAAQSVGKLTVDMHAMQVDLLSICAHKFHGPKGSGALCVRRRPPLRLAPILHGGGHERGLRSGTLPTHQIVGLGAACRIAGGQLGTEPARIASLRDALRAELASIDGLLFNSPAEGGAPGILSLCVDGVEGESLITDLREIGVSSGSACTSASLEPSHVLRAIGRSAEQAQASLRVSFGRFNTVDHVAVAARDIRRAVDRLRGLAPR